MKKQEQGRSLTEMLGVLAVIGILSIGAVVGYKYAGDKITANRIYNDIKLAYMDIHTSHNVPYQWTQSAFRPDSGYTLFVRRDKSANDFVRVDMVDEGVCSRLLELANDGKEMTLYNINSESLMCAGEQNIIASFSGEPPLIPCENGVSDCPEGYNSYCDNTKKICQKCELGQRTNDSGTGCVDLCADRTDGQTLSCLSEEYGVNWCCPADGVCSDKIGQCVSDENACIYELKKTDFKANCAGTITFSSTFSTNCSGTVTFTTLPDGQKQASIQTQGCKTGEFCQFGWTKETWNANETEPLLTDATTTKIYGQCHGISTTSSVTAYPTATLNITQGCGEGQFCQFGWTKDAWGSDEDTPSLTDVTMTKIYGQCHGISTTSSVTAYSTIKLSPIKACDDGLYCHIQWENGDCSVPLKTVSTDRVYGACATLSGSNTQCPVDTQGLIFE